MGGDEKDLAAYFGWSRISPIESSFLGTAVSSCIIIELGSSHVRAGQAMAMTGILNGQLGPGGLP